MERGVAISWLKKRVKAGLPRGQFSRNVFLLAGGTALGQAVTVLVSPVLTRLYTPEDFGVLAVYSSILGILSVVASWRYELAIPLPEEDEDAANLAVLSLFIVALMSLVTSLGVWFLRDQIAHWTRTSTIRPYLWLLPIGLLLVGSYQVFNYWAIRNQMFWAIAHTKLNQGLGAAFTQIGGGFFQLGPLGLIIGQIVGQCAGLTALVRSSLKNRNWVKMVNRNKVLGVARRYYRFPKFSSWSALINTAGLQLPVILLSSLYGPQVAGWFTLAQRVLGVPMNMVGQAISQVYVGTASRLVHNDVYALRRLFLKIALRLLLIGGVPLGILAVGGPWVFVRVFGSNWENTGRYLQVLSLAFLAQFAIVPLSQTVNILERQEWQLKWDIFRLLSVVLAIVVPFVFGWSSQQAIFVYSFSMIVVYSVLFLMNLLLLDQVVKGRKPIDKQ